METGSGHTKLDVSFFTNEDPRERPLPLRRILLPWATPYDPKAVVAERREVPEIAGGDWARGKQVFFGEKVACFKCHTVGGQGGKIGPDLSSLTQRDYASVLKDITQPSAAINPDHIAYNVELKDGTFLSGVVMSDTGDSVVLGQVTGQSVTVPRNQIANMKASSISLMPEGLLQQLTAQEQKDLLTFLLMTEPGK
jgi:putative heme-binding domain-containing protein